MSQFYTDTWMQHISVQYFYTNLHNCIYLKPQNRPTNTGWLTETVELIFFPPFYLKMANIQPASNTENGYCFLPAERTPHRKSRKTAWTIITEVNTAVYKLIWLFDQNNPPPCVFFVLSQEAHMISITVCDAKPTESQGAACFKPYSMVF